MHNLVNRSLRSPGTFHRNAKVGQAGEAVPDQRCSHTG
jgi:hypothetical protein